MREIACQWAPLFSRLSVFNRTANKMICRFTFLSRVEIAELMAKLKTLIIVFVVAWKYHSSDWISQKKISTISGMILFIAKYRISFDTLFEVGCECFREWMWVQMIQQTTSNDSLCFWNVSSTFNFPCESSKWKTFPRNSPTHYTLFVCVINI